MKREYFETILNSLYFELKAKATIDNNASIKKIPCDLESKLPVAPGASLLNHALTKTSNLLEMTSSGKLKKVERF